jgi:hypothetical protein
MSTARFRKPCSYDMGRGVEESIIVRTKLDGSRLIDPSVLLSLCSLTLWSVI